MLAHVILNVWQKEAFRCCFQAGKLRVQRRQQHMNAQLTICQKKGYKKKKLWNQSRQHVSLNFKGLSEQEPKLSTALISQSSHGGDSQWRLSCLKSDTTPDLLWTKLSLHSVFCPVAVLSNCLSFGYFCKEVRANAQWSRMAQFNLDFNCLPHWDDYFRWLTFLDNSLRTTYLNNIQTCNAR